MFASLFLFFQYFLLTSGNKNYISKISISFFVFGFSGLLMYILILFETQVINTATPQQMALKV